MTISPYLHIHSTNTVGQEAAKYIAQLATEATAKRGRFTVAFSGGSLPKLVCPSLVALPLKEQIDWSSWHVFWADERCVPLEHSESNYRLTKEYLFDHVDLLPAQIYPIEPTLSPAQAAQTYQSNLQNLFQTELPTFDLILLGMGPDGHTASLFPQHALLNETNRWVAPITDSPKPPPERITLTLPVINHARQVVFVATGASKADILPQVLVGNPAYPAQHVHPDYGQLHWFVDEAAAVNIDRKI